MEMIKTQDLAFTYPGTEDQVNTRALRGVDVAIERGSFVVILGHNGSGKSTLAKTFNAVLLPSGGKVYVEGMDTMDESLLLEIRRRVGMVFQNPDNQIVANVVEEDVAFAPENLGVPSAEIRKRVDDALEAVGMTQFVKHAPHLLSGGQKQRIAIVRSLAMEPEVLVLDEPRRGKEFFRTFDLPAYLRKHFNMFGGTEYRVTLRCTADLEPVMRERFGREPVFCPEDAEHFHFDVPICVSQQFFGWVCGFGGKVEVTAPAAVRAQLHEMLQSLAEQHG